MSGAIWFVQQAWSAAFPFLLAAACVIALSALHDGVAWFVRRGLTRRRQRLQGGQR